jgi:branched-chain amino acid aminotransferase
VRPGRPGDAKPPDRVVLGAVLHDRLHPAAYVVDGELRTPTLSSGCLAGVTRALVVEWCGAREVDEPLATVLDTASEVFLASTTRDVQAVARWDHRDLPAPGPVTRRCAETWAAREAETLDP